MRNVVIAFGFVLLASSATAQTPPVKNPTGLEFTCPDHATDDGHEVDIVRESDGAVIQTISAGDPAEVAGKVTVTLNVQPVAFGVYRFVVRALAGTLVSSNSPSSDTWERVPGRPGKPVVLP